MFDRINFDNRRLMKVACSYIDKNNNDDDNNDRSKNTTTNLVPVSVRQPTEICGRHVQHRLRCVLYADAQSTRTFDALQSSEVLL